MCLVEDCRRLTKCRNLCGMHYHRWQRHGDPTICLLASDRRCSIEGCDERTNARGFCNKHYHRFRKYGDPLFTKYLVMEHRPTMRNRYLSIWAPDHPLAESTSPRLRVHRIVLFDAIGYGPHWCVHCGQHINWHVGLEVDHLDWDRANNDRANLAESCRPCNAGRQVRVA